MPLRFPAFKYLLRSTFILLIYATVISAADYNEYLIKISGQSAIRKSSTQDLLNHLGLDSTSQLHSAFHSPNFALAGWYLLKIPQTAQNKLEEMISAGKINSYQENRILKISDTIPNDSLYHLQWYHHKVKALQAWNFISVREKIILAIIDTGIDYTHPDLQNTMWINKAEDLNANGKLDAGDINNIDDDGNGYLDDVSGWDFTDAPRYRDRGDYIDPDNDPMDDYSNGHGTQIAGIIGAESNNEQGISGLLPSVQIMNLRAGTSQGYLEEDDVARAIVYAVENGARIINMSFGDVVVSPFLRDVIGYAYSQGTVMLASAGNSGTNEIHYPAGFPETISVGATDETDLMTVFSNRGTTVDLVAPGNNIISTAINNSYNTVNGTSFSAPIAAAGAVIVLMENPEFGPDEVRNILKTSSDDLGPTGWDEEYGSGRINLERIARNDFKSSLMIHMPKSGSSTAEHVVPVIVTAQNPDLEKIQLFSGLGNNPDSWNELIAGYPYQVINDTLAILDLSGVPDTSLVLRLVVNTLNSVQSEYRALIQVDRSPPVISNWKSTEITKDNHSSLLLEFTTDEPTTGEIFFHNTDSEANLHRKNLTYETRNHRVLLDALEISGDVEYYIQVRNLSGLTTVSGKAQIFISPSFIDNEALESYNTTIPPGYALPVVTDLDQDGLEEIVISKYDSQNNFGPVQVYEYDGIQFVRIYETDFPAIPRSAGDADQDGRLELFLGYGNTSKLLEFSGVNPLTAEIVRQDTGLWASNICDSDNDGIYELIMRADKNYLIFENSGDNQFIEIAQIDNPSDGSNSLGPPHTVITDLDGDGRMELVFGDYDGDVIISENTGDNTYIWRHTERLAYSDATSFLVAARLRTNGTPSLIAGTHINDNANYEHEFDARYWQFTALHAAGDNQYYKSDPISIYGYSDLRYFDSGINSGPLVPGENDYLILAPSPNIYIYQWHNENIVPVWHGDDANTNTVIIHDFDRNGADEFYYNDGQRFKSRIFARGDRPAPPAYFEVQPLDTSRIRLRWQVAKQANYFRIYRGTSAYQMMPYDSTDNSFSYTDSVVIKDTLYYYAVTVVDQSFPSIESHLTKTLSARPNYAPEIDSIAVIKSSQVQVFFNEPMDKDSFLPQNFFLQPGDINTSSVISGLNGRSCLLSFNQEFETGIYYNMFITNVLDSDHTPLDLRYQQVNFYYEEPENLPYIQEWNYTGKYTIDVLFNMPMDTITVLNTQNYYLVPSGHVENIQMLDSDMTRFSIKLSNDTFTGSSGITTYLDFSNLKSLQGRTFASGNRINLSRLANNIEDIFVYPQPLNVNMDWIGFANVARSARLDIFDLSGRKIITLNEADANGGIRWDLIGQNGQRIPAGIYFYHARWENQTKTGKFAILR